jgi:hypothetical protein
MMRIENCKEVSVEKRAESNAMRMRVLELISFTASHAGLAVRNSAQVKVVLISLNESQD